MSELKQAFFTDKLRGLSTLLLLIIILCVVSLSWLFPKQSSVSQKTLDTLQNVANQMERVGNNIERVSMAQEKRNTILEQQLMDSKVTRDAAYKALEDKYGTYPGDAKRAATVERLQSETVDERGGHVPVSASPTGKNK